MTETTLQRPVFLAPFAAKAAALAAAGPSWLRELRRVGAERFERLGVPTTKLEDWKGTNVTGIAKIPFAPAAERPVARPDSGGFAQIDLGGPRLVFVDGRFDREQSRIGDLPAGVRVGRLSDALGECPERLESLWQTRQPGESTAFADLNAALFDDGAAILIPDRTRLDAPITILHLASTSNEPVAVHTRTAIVAGRGSAASVVEIHAGGGANRWSNTVGDTMIGDGAELRHYRLQVEAAGGYHLADRRSSQGRDSRLSTFDVDLGAGLARHDVRGILDGEGADLRLWGLYLVQGNQVVDHHTIIDHAKPHGDSRELYKGILDGQSRTVFCGRIIVREGAQKTDSKQSNPNLLLSDGALAQTRPQLEIHANDVKCTHGATIGRLDDSALFYLQSRGLAPADAESLMIEAFAEEVLGEVSIAPVRETLRRAVFDRLERRSR